MLLRREAGGQAWLISTVRPPVHPCEVPPLARCEYTGNAAGLIVADRAPQVGLIVAFGDVYRAPGVPVDSSAVWSHDAGTTWSTMEDRYFFVSTQLFLMDTDIPGPFRIPFTSAAALDPATGEFYVVASAKRGVGSKNIDLYVIRGRTVAGSPPIAFDPPVRLELDGRAIFEDGPDQFMPSIAIDGVGGINLLFYETRHNPVPDDYPSAFLDAYYTRITGFGTSHQQVFTARLSPTTFCTDCLECGFPNPCEYEDPSLVQFIGDYNTIDAAGCDAYVAYMTTETGQRHYYVRRIDLCPPDADDNLVVNTIDVSSFQALFAAHDPKADFNRDGIVDVNDLAGFLASYASWSP
jgi:hypothetical protein